MLRKQPSLAVAPLCALTRCLSGREALNKTKTGPSSTRYRIPSLHALPFGQRSPQQDQNWSRQHSLSHPPRCTRYLHFHRIRYHSLRHSLPLTRLCVCAVCAAFRAEKPSTRPKLVPAALAIASPSLHSLPPLSPHSLPQLATLSPSHTSVCVCCMHSCTWRVCSCAHAEVSLRESFGSAIHTSHSEREPW